MTHAKVQNGQITTVGLPTTGELADGRTVSNFHLLDDPVLRDEGWLPVTDDPPAHDPATQTLVMEGYDVGADAVTTRYRVEWLPPSLTADKTAIAADGVDAATVTYRHHNPDTRPASVTFDVNGLTSAVDLDAEGTAGVRVTAANPGPVTVAVEATVPVTITAT